jgi:hypothetical protein
MARYPHNFNFYDEDFNLYNDCQNEIINMRGIEVVYLPRQDQKADLILGEDPLSKFNETYSMIMYLANFSEFGGQGDLFGNFGITITDQANFEINMGEFGYIADGLVPVEGDLIYVPMGNWLMEIFHVEKDDPFFHMGKPSKYIFLTRMADYSHEELDTGIEKVDSLNSRDGTDIDSENDEIDDELDGILNLSEPNIFGDK